MPRLKVRERAIHLFDSETDGPPVVLLHSSGMNSLQWRTTIRVLSPRFRVLAPDLMGYGQSEPWPVGQPFDFREDVAVLHAVLEYAAAPAHLVGHSYGGLIAMLGVAGGHGQIASVAAFEPVVFGVLRSGDGLEALGPFADQTVAEEFFELGDRGLEGWMERFVEWWNGPGAWSVLPERQQAALLQAVHKTYDEVRTLAFDETPHTAFEGFEGPALLVSGTLSPPAGQRVCEILAETFVRGRLVRIEGAGHMGPILAARAVNCALAEHLDIATGGRAR